LFSACNGTAPAVQGTGASTASTTGSTTFAAAETATPTVQQPKGNPQPKLPTIKLWVGTNQISAEIASSVDQIRAGMMFRTNMAEMEGMLFVFPMPQQLAFYMRNTLLLHAQYSPPALLRVYRFRRHDRGNVPNGTAQRNAYSLKVEPDSIRSRDEARLVRAAQHQSRDGPFH
jgi:hypothetical protein